MIAAQKKLVSNLSVKISEVANELFRGRFWYPNGFIPPRGTLARERWDKNKAGETFLKSGYPDLKKEKAFLKLIEESYGWTGTGDGQAIFLRS